ncbi:MAG: winged helix DNA-binding domain-containing protein [Candidatus Hermodarchaeota archaeon]
METFKLSNVNNFVLQKQHLTPNSKIDDIIQITKDICGLHSTELSTSYLSLLERTNNFKKEDLEKELYENKTLGRIRGMRRTLFIQTKEMIPIVHAATYKLSEKNFKKYMEFHKVSLSEYQNISNQILNLLNGRELSATEIRKELDSTLNIPAIIQLMCNYGLLIRGKPIKDWKDRRNKYAKFASYFPNMELAIENETKALQILVEKYIRRYGPATENDLSWWTGLTKSEIRKRLSVIEPELIKIKISSIQGICTIFKSDLEGLTNHKAFGKPILSLLPKLDPYPMGYKERERYINSENYNQMFDRSGNATSTIFLDGVAIGVWDVEEKPEPTIKYHLFHTIEKDLIAELHSKATKIGKFYFDEEVQILECKSMVPLTERTAGGFMTPLKNC